MMYLPIIIACLPDMSLCNQHGITQIVRPFGPQVGLGITEMIETEEACLDLVGNIIMFLEEETPLIVVEGTCYSFAPGEDL